MRRITAIILVSLLTLLAACGAEEPADETDLSEVDGADLLTRSADRMEEVDSFHFEIEHENGSTEIVSGIQMERAEGDVQGSDRMQVDVDASFASANIETGIVILPDQSYLQNPLTGNWQEQDIDITDIFDPATGVTGLMRDVDNAEVIAREEANGVDSYLLETAIDSGNLEAFVASAEAGTEVTARLWIGVEDLLVRRIELVGPITPNDNENVLRRVTLSQFDEPVEITAPN